MIFDTIKEATYEWVNSFNAVPYSVVTKLLERNPDELMEVTPPSKYDRVCILAGRHQWEYGEIVKFNPNSETYTVELDGGMKIRVKNEDMEVQRDDYLPMWGTLWAFDESIDNWWLEEDGGLQKMADCGFRIYEQEDYGYIFGIDGAGYDFYEAHWIPLYKARGLHWHREEGEAA